MGKFIKWVKILLVFFFNLIIYLFYSWEMNYDICFVSWEMNDIYYVVLLVCRNNGKIYKVG